VSQRAVFLLCSLMVVNGDGNVEDLLRSVNTNLSCHLELLTKLGQCAEMQTELVTERK